MNGTDHNGTAVDIRKNAGEVIRIEPSDFKGFDLVNLRVWYEAEGEHGETVLRPTRKGVTFRRELLPPVIEALKALADDQAASVG